MLQGYNEDSESSLCCFLSKAALWGNPEQFCITADLRGDSPNDVIKGRMSLGNKSEFSGDDFMK